MQASVRLASRCDPLMHHFGVKKADQIFETCL